MVMSQIKFQKLVMLFGSQKMRELLKEVKQRLKEDM